MKNIMAELVFFFFFLSEGKKEGNKKLRVIRKLKTRLYKMCLL